MLREETYTKSDGIGKFSGNPKILKCSSSLFLLVLLTVLTGGPRVHQTVLAAALGVDQTVLKISGDVKTGSLII